jgi:hypothetical protein
MQTLTVLIAFVAIILLLSILVTTLVQFTQGLLRVRGRNLVTGLATLISASQPGERAALGPTRKFQRAEARRILNSVQAGNLAPDVKPAQRTMTRIVGPVVSWIDAGRFISAARAVGDPAIDLTKAEELFPVVEAAMEKRFQLFMRLLSLAWGLALAVLFQVSTPQLFHQLWMNPERATQIADRADTYLSGAEQVIGNFHDYEEAAASALVELAERYPDSRERIEQASGIGTNRKFIIEELRTALAGDANNEAILGDYAEKLDAWERDYVAGLSRTVGYASGELRAIGFVPMPERHFFFDGGIRWANVIGVMITGMLLMLGAPFWFNTLRNLVSLRDALAGKPKKDVPAAAAQE